MYSFRHGKRRAEIMALRNHPSGGWMSPQCRTDDDIFFHCIPLYSVLHQLTSLPEAVFDISRISINLKILCAHPQPSGAFAEGDGQSEARAL